MVGSGDRCSFVKMYVGPAMHRFSQTLLCILCFLSVYSVFLFAAVCKPIAVTKMRVDAGRLPRRVANEVHRSLPTLLAQHSSQ